ncbi:DUF1707 SHOCT-like domain-containing protein [Solicola gregarius]|uniref:DUF1707 domain-containing protein n=1 Tax=Solicola gregarius TaxID=2908642 RepID=A0AA46TEI7_9ACTN|nr:DUF1707 domain-containing protein [Solicola gregarius]UYM03894.1 DUF1707 domain-containing protein [Solicola gregarius]
MASDGDRQKRARDDDRDRVVAALDDAYVDGQIDADEREARIAATLSARTLAELDAVLADLQVENVLPEPEPSSSRAPVIAAVAAVAVLGFIGWQIVGDGPEPPDSSIGSVSEAESAVTGEDVVMWSDVENELSAAAPSGKGIRVPEIQGWSGSEEDIRALIDAYREKRGDYVVEASFRPEYATLSEPLGGADPTSQVWSYYPHDPMLRSSAAASDGVRDRVLVDLRDLNLDQLFANFEYALTELNVEDAQLLYISVNEWNGAPQIQIYVRAKRYSNEVGYLNTTLEGERTSVVAHDGA